MNFFEQQHRARRRTWLMLLLFVLAVAAIVAAFDLVCAVVYILLFDPQILYSSSLLQRVPRSVYVWSTLATLLVIGWGTASRLYQLSGGGVAVADLIGARHVKRDTGEPAERRLLNVVEEMALASGITVPLVFVMDDQHAINAFAAGYSPNEATVIVTRGALEQLNRDELQGVVAHEFSHILNGDMRLNIHLVGVIAGIVMIGSIGAFLMTGIRDGDDLRRAGTDIRVFFLGLLLWLIGSIGVLAGRLIKAVISRQREFLADASAVQFTRNPDGIGGALFKIGRHGSTIAQRHAEELSHMCIGPPVNDYFEFASFHDHPPLDDRIERLLGTGAKRLLRERMERAEAAALSAQGSPVVSEFVSPLYAPRTAAPAAGQPGAGGFARSMVESIGNPSSAHIDHARGMLEAIPVEIRTALGHEEGAQAALFALLLGEGELRKAQLALIGAGEIPAQSARFADALKPLGARARLPVLQLVIPTLKRLPGPERDGLLEKIKAVIEADRKITLGEFVLLTLCRSYIRSGEKRPAAVKYRSVQAVVAEAGVILSLLAQAGGGGMAAFNKGMAALGIAGGVLRSPSELNIATVEGALNELNLLAPLKKPFFIKACVATAMADDKLTLAEGELLRAICAALDSPLPPILETTEAVE